MENFMGDFQVAGTWSGTDRKLRSHHLFGAQGGILRFASLDSSATEPPGHDCYGQQNSSVLYQQAGWTRSYSLLRLVVELFLGLHS